MADDVLVLTGATATGKTALGIAIAQRLGGEIISMDSRQVYRGMDIGTAKPSPAERSGVPHHGFDRVDPDERYSAGRFAREARQWMAGIRARGALPMLVGGTGFFLRALTHPLFDEPPLDEARRRALHRRLQCMDTGELRRWAAALDPATPPEQDRQRLCRALELALLTGRPLSWWQRHGAARVAPVEAKIFVLDLAPAALRERIDVRVTHMIRAGLVEEVLGLIARGYTERDPGMSATGYAEFIPYTRGDRTLEEAAELTRFATRRYARRQRTWFRHQLPAGVTRLDATEPMESLVDKVLDEWKRAGR